MTTTYTTKSTAVRGAKRAGLEVGSYSVEQDADGKFFVKTTPVIATMEELKDAAPGEYVVTGEAATELMKQTAIDLIKKGSVKSTPEEIAARRAERLARIGKPAPAPVVKEKKSSGPTYKEIMNKAPDRSVIEKPVAFVHAYLAINYGLRTRKVLINELVAMGLNFNMVKSQYQTYHSRLKEAKEEGTK